jgi:hypothetical protein
VRAQFHQAHLADLREGAGAAAADQKYKDKTLEVTGTVSVIHNEPGLRGIGFGLPQDQWPAVLCDVAQQDRDVLATLKAGQTVTVRGTCQGK